MVARYPRFALPSRSRAWKPKFWSSLLGLVGFLRVRNRISLFQYLSYRVTLEARDRNMGDDYLHNLDDLPYRAPRQSAGQSLHVNHYYQRARAGQIGHATR